MRSRFLRRCCDTAGSCGSVRISGMRIAPRLSATLTPPPRRSISVLTIDTPAISSSNPPVTITDIPINCCGVACARSETSVAAMAAKFTITVMTSTAKMKRITSLFDAARTSRWRSKKFIAPSELDVRGFADLRAGYLQRCRRGKAERAREQRSREHHALVVVGERRSRCRPGGRTQRGSPSTSTPPRAASCSGWP